MYDTPAQRATARLLVKPMISAPSVTSAALLLAFSLFLGGAALEGPRYLWWNFVSSRKERIEQAKAEWKSGRFALIPGDDKEFIPLPDA